MKKALLYFALLGLALPIFIACKKDPLEFTVKGTVYDESFNQGLEGAKVTFKALDANSGDLRIIGETTLDETGNYSFTFLRKRDQEFQFTAEKDNYYLIDETIYFPELTVESDNVFDYSTSAKSYVKFKIKNTGASEETDQLKLEIYEAKTNCEDCCGLGQRYFNGTNIDTNLYCANDGNEYYKFIYWVPEISLVVFDSLITPPFDTVEYLIEY